MVTVDTFRELALSFPNVTEQPHFEKTSFRVNKKIFTTLDAGKKQAVLKLSETDQSVYCMIDAQIIYPVKNKWGKQGWTVVELKQVKSDVLKEAIAASFHHVFPGVKQKAASGKKLKVCPQGHRFYKSSDCPVCPICEAGRKPDSSFMAGLAAPARRALASQKIDSLKELSAYSEESILKLHGMGKSSIPKLKQLLAEAGLSFKA